MSTHTRTWLRVDHTREVLTRTPLLPNEPFLLQAHERVETLDFQRVEGRDEEVGGCSTHGARAPEGLAEGNELWVVALVQASDVLSMPI